MKIKIVANNNNWFTLRKKVDELKEWFKPLVDITFDIQYTSFSIPFSPYRDGMLGVDREWYDDNVTPLGYGYDIVLLVVPRSEWQEPNRARGWRTDSDQGPVELQISCDEKEDQNAGGWSQLNGSAFALLARHEILHALFMISGQLDTTHYWWDQGKLENCLKEIKLPKDTTQSSVNRTFAYLIKMFSKDSKIVSLAKSKLGTDFTNDKIVPDEVSCAFAVTTLLKEAGVNIPIITGTAQLDGWLKQNATRIYEPEAGCIVVSPTGSGSRPDIISNGHTGIYLDNYLIVSNDSASGLWKQNYNRDTWRARYYSKGGYPVRLYKI